MKFGKNRLICIFLNIFLILILLSLAFGLHNTFYEMKVNNCNSILSSNYSVSTEDVADCYRFINYPSFEFNMDYYLLFGLLHLSFGLILNFILSLGLEMWEKEE